MMRWISMAVLVWSGAGAAAVEAPPSAPAIATFSICGRDPDTGELGVAVASKFVAVGAVVPYAEAGVGAVATQAWANPAYGPGALRELAAGQAPDAVVATLTGADPQAAKRQLGVLAADGGAATFTGGGCHGWAGGAAGEDCVAQGNLLAGEDVVTAMIAAFEAAAGAGKPLAERLLDALEAGQAAGGDKRGKQSAALLVVREGWGYGGGNDRFRDLRVDEHADPLPELRRVYRAHRRLFPRPRPRAPRPE